MAKGKYQDWISEEGLIKIEGWAKDGLTDKQIAKNIGISAKTLYRWKDKYSHFCHALKRGKEVVDREVENALLKRALGYEAIETRKETDGVSKKIVEIKKHIPADTTAIIYWLKNRKPEEWRDKKEVEQLNKNINIEIGDWNDQDED